MNNINYSHWQAQFIMLHWSVSPIWAHKEAKIYYSLIQIEYQI